MYLGVKGKYKNLKHHNLLFSKDWKHNFAQIFDQPDKFPPGAVFFMLETMGATPRSSFGALSSISSGELLFNDTPIDDLAGLVNQCLAVQAG